MKHFKKIIKVIITSLFILILAYNLYNFISLKILKKDLATIGGYGVLEVVSNSMKPTISKGDLIVINTKGYKYQEKDIITFYDEENNFVTHRVAIIEDDEIITKGDNNDSLDRGINKNNIVGKYVFKIAYLGTIFRIFRNPIVLIIIFVIGVLVCIFITDKEEFQEFQEFLVKKSEEINAIGRNRKRKKSNKKKKRKRKKRKQRR